MKTEIPNWVAEYNNAGHQSSAGKAVKILMTRISELEGGWIKFDDQYPIDYQRVLWFDKRGGDIEVGYFVPSQSKIPTYATHWQPLPNPPQQ